MSVSEMTDAEWLGTESNRRHADFQSPNLSSPWYPCKCWRSSKWQLVHKLFEPELDLISSRVSEVQGASGETRASNKCNSSGERDKPAPAPKAGQNRNQTTTNCRVSWENRASAPYFSDMKTGKCRGELTPGNDARRRSQKLSAMIDERFKNLKARHSKGRVDGHEREASCELSGQRAHSLARHHGRRSP